MKLDDLRSRMLSFDSKDESFTEIYEELEASYQQMLAMADQLSHAEKHYELLIQNMSDIVWVANTEGEITYINTVVEDILGYNRTEMIGRKMYEFMCPLHTYKEGFCRDVVQLMNEKEFHRHEMWMLHKDGNTRKVIEVNTKQLFYDGRLSEIQGVGRDISDRIQIQRKIQQKNRQMKFIEDISTAINSHRSLEHLDRLLIETCKNIVNTVNVPLCTIRLKDESDQLQLKAAFGRYKDIISKGPLDGNESYLKSVMKDKLPLIIDKETAAETSDDVRAIFKQDQIKNLLILPISTHEVTIGTMAIGVEGLYDSDYSPLYTSLANNLAFAIEKSKLYQDQKAYYINIIMTLVAAMEAKDSYTQGHSFRVSEYAVKIAEHMGLSAAEVEEIQISGILHDIGKIGISDLILTKPGLLSPEEYEEVKKHPSIGMRILDKIGLSDNIRDGILYHHLRFDLEGYPEDITASLTEQPLFARIIGAADALDAMTSHRVYKSAMNCQEVRAELKRCAGTQFCNVVVEALIDLLENRLIITMNEC